MKSTIPDYSPLGPAAHADTCTCLAARLERAEAAAAEWQALAQHRASVLEQAEENWRRQSLELAGLGSINAELVAEGGRQSERLQAARLALQSTRRFLDEISSLWWDDTLEHWQEVIGTIDAGLDGRAPPVWTEAEIEQGKAEAAKLAVLFEPGLVCSRCHSRSAILTHTPSGQLCIDCRAAAQDGPVEARPKPIPMVLPCPRCGLLHVDAPEPAAGWTNPPHRSHLCHACGLIWRPADVPTTGVAAIATRGSADTWPREIMRHEGDAEANQGTHPAATGDEPRQVSMSDLDGQLLQPPEDPPDPNCCPSCHAYTAGHGICCDCAEETEDGEWHGTAQAKAPPKDPPALAPERSALSEDASVLMDAFMGDELRVAGQVFEVAPEQLRSRWRAVARATRRLNATRQPPEPAEVERIAAFVEGFRPDDYEPVLGRLAAAIRARFGGGREENQRQPATQPSSQEN